MKLIKKIILLTLASSLLFETVLFAQDQDQQDQGQQNQQGQTQNQQGQWEDLSDETGFPQRIGAYFSYAPTVGVLREFVSSSIGGGIAYEFGFKLPLGMEFGPVAHLAVNGNPVRSDKIVSMMNLEFDIGAFFRLPFGKSGFVFQPEFDYGVLVYFPKVNSEYDNSDTIQGAYVDQLLQIGAGFRFSHPNFLNGNMEVELTPTYLFSPEQGETIHFIGFRTGFLYRLDSLFRSAKSKGGAQ